MIGHDAAEVIARLYEVALDRDGEIDRTGLNFWIDVAEADLAGGVGEAEALASVAAAFIASPEFGASVGDPETLSDREFVERIYANLFERAGDAEGLDFWTEALSSESFDRADLLVAFAASPEGIAATPEILLLEEVAPGEWWFGDGAGAADLPADPSTPAVIPGDDGRLVSAIDPADDADWIEVVLPGPGEYAFRARGATNDQLTDPAIALYEADWEPGDLPFARNDDSDRFEPAIFLRVAEAQSVFLEVVSDAFGPGVYRAETTAATESPSDPRDGPTTQYHVRPGEDGAWRLTDSFDFGTLPGDDGGDWYAMVLGAGQTAAVRLDALQDGDALLSIRDGDGRELVAAEPGADSLDFVAPSLGTYHVAVERDGADLAYDLEVLIA